VCVHCRPGAVVGLWQKSGTETEAKASATRHRTP